MGTKTRRLRAFTFIEAIVATFIMVVAIAAMFATYMTCFKTSQAVTETTSAAEIAQAELEIAKVYGAANMPLGTYSSSTQTATWTGAYIPSTGWTSGALAYYNYSGTQLASSSSAGAYFSVSLTMVDSSVLAGTGGTYTLQASSNRALVVTVTNIAKNVVDYTMATNLVQGGL